MSTFLARLSSNLMEFISFFSLSENLLSWSAEVPWRVWVSLFVCSCLLSVRNYPEIASVGHPGSSKSNNRRSLKHRNYRQRPTWGRSKLCWCRQRRSDQYGVPAALAAARSSWGGNPAGARQRRRPHLVQWSVAKRPTQHIQYTPNFLNQQ